MSFASLASLAVAALDLHLVQDVIGAIRAADANVAAMNAGKIPPVAPAASPARAATTEQHPCDPICRQQDSTNRQTIRFLPAEQDLSRSHWVRPELKTRLALLPDAPKPGGDFTVINHPVPAVQPPWKTLPWQQPPRQIVQVKRVVQHTDIVSKGSLIDVFI